jgi:16S rRNA (guanine966-N2)-methyltransferase
VVSMLVILVKKLHFLLLIFILSLATLSTAAAAFSLGGGAVQQQRLSLSRKRTTSALSASSSSFTSRSKTFYKPSPAPSPPDDAITGTSEPNEETAGAVPKLLKWEKKIRAKRPKLGNVVGQNGLSYGTSQPGDAPLNKLVATAIGTEDENDDDEKSSSSSPGDALLAGKRIGKQGYSRLTARSQNNPSNLKILGGIARGRKLVSPDVYLRPMMGKVREALFSSLTSAEVYSAALLSGAPCRHLDVFAGSGSVGLESLSRGATGATFIDFSKACTEVISTNVDRCGFSSKSSSHLKSGDDISIKCCDALGALKNPEKHGFRSDEEFHIVTVTPPYEEIIYSELIDAVVNSPLLADDAIVVIEYPIELGCLPHVLGDWEKGGRTLVGIRNRRYGRTVIGMYICRPTGQLPNAISRPEEFIKV